ncbi:MAG: undecaprenyl/decaprenyl-phosphate alpha-N-acetylglucosaminyl 1-phosphate transferase [Paenibacillaceae bacterium]|jgi:UDP-GlcNAc:undecaprenyl-phosphate GlcNAc-1-phosphate transferase|nr:undecaprenyl/decaprenyl-phosphate alpha-N-acetylglucosaminyl 1-phosphate transferase [Paenibacillaceae bacterium]
MDWWIYVIGFAAACALAVVATPYVKKLAFRIGAISVPNHRSVHTKPMPQMGGLAIFIAFAVTYLVVALSTGQYDLDVMMGMLFGGTIIVLVGIYDDRYNISPKLKLLGQIAAAAAVTSCGLYVDYIQLPFGDAINVYPWVGIIITILWIVGVTNAINLIDGLDGLAAGVSAIATLTIMVLSFITGNWPVALLSAILLGSIIGFLFFNFHPASIFMGDTGALFLGFSLATLSILGFKSAVAISFLVPILVLGVPLSDTVLAIIRRKLNHKPISVADKGHLHHCLMDLGFSTRRTVLIIYGVAAVFGSCAMLLSQTKQWGTIVLVVIVLLIMEIGAEAVGIISKSKKPVLRLLQRWLADTPPSRSGASK